MKTVKLDIWVDGSYNLATQTSGGGIFIRLLDKDGMEFDEGALQSDILSYEGGYCIADSIAVDDVYGSRNVTGEILAVHRAITFINKLKELFNIQTITFNYDYTGIKEWAVGNWRAKTQLTKEYKDAITLCMSKHRVYFNRVSAHTGVAYNELVDSLAKGACGIKR